MQVLAKIFYICQSSVGYGLLTCSSLFHHGSSYLDAPQFKGFPAPYTLVRLGDPLNLSCDVDSNPPANILWTKNGEFVGGGNKYLIPEVHDDDYGVYGCMATLGGQSSKIFASTKVLQPGLIIFDFH